MKKYWITKYALTDGITSFDAESRRRYGGAEIVSRANGLVASYIYYIVGSEAFDNEPAAIADAEKRRAKKIASLERQLVKLRELTFKAGGRA